MVNGMCLLISCQQHKIVSINSIFQMPLRNNRLLSTLIIFSTGDMPVIILSMQEDEKMCSPSTRSVRNMWTKDQDTRLSSLVAVHGSDCWPAISVALNFAFPSQVKSPQQCCKRWREMLEVENDRKEWTEEDELRMIIAHKKYKNRWASISECLKGRSNNTIKNKFYSVFRKVRGKILKCDCTHISKLELLEIHYMISLIEHHLANPLLTPKVKGKRGKDFIYSLIYNLSLKEVSEYKWKINELYRVEGTMEELFSELAEELRRADLDKMRIGRQGVSDAGNGEMEGRSESISNAVNPIVIEDDTLQIIKKNEITDYSPPVSYTHLTLPTICSV
eukprot:TRINITY_DN2245_c0_g1_i5.p1 TRINITY_DN2245_c0_g1~~TRINITY_DN2245_c0_g1_i5.p1  ORF type:complete len:369 (-),score=79.02 TRINITY_DN2245_c0_g1_i5:46-1047(-)